MNTALGIFLGLVVLWCVLSLVSELGYPRRREAILQALREARQPLYGLDLIARGLGKRGTIYLDLHRMEDEGVIYSWREPRPVYPQHIPRRYYALTPKGHDAVERGRS